MWDVTPWSVVGTLLTFSQEHTCSIFEGLVKLTPRWRWYIPPERWQLSAVLCDDTSQEVVLLLVPCRSRCLPALTLFPCVCLPCNKDRLHLLPLSKATLKTGGGRAKVTSNSVCVFVCVALTVTHLSLSLSCLLLRIVPKQT